MSREKFDCFLNSDNMLVDIASQDMLDVLSFILFDDTGLSDEKKNKLLEEKKKND